MSSGRMASGQGWAMVLATSALSLVLSAATWGAEEAAAAAGQTVAESPAAPLTETPSADAAATESLNPPAAVLDPEYLEDLAVFLYWWYLDEEDLDLGDRKWFVFRVRRLRPEADEADHSEWAEIRLPAFKLGVVVKRPDYVIEETGDAVKGKMFRIVNLFRLDGTEGGEQETDGWQRVDLSLPDMLEEIYARYEHRRFPDAELTERLHRACRRAMNLDVNGREAGDQVMHIAPLSDVANEAWVYLENQCLLLQFTTDREIEEPGGDPDGADMRVRGYDLIEDTITTPEEIPGTTQYMTMDQAGRALYNCLVLGKRLIVLNPEDAQETPIVKEFVVGRQ